jgi:hypothetical protein
MIRPSQPAQQALTLLDETVTIRVADLYEYLFRRRGGSTMPDLNQATTVKRAKRGYRRISMLLKVSEYETIAQIAEQESRTPDQQAAHMLRKLLIELQTEAIRRGYKEAVDRRVEGERLQGWMDSEPEADASEDEAETYTAEPFTPER